jgi:hypothetical protein
MDDEPHLRKITRARRARAMRLLAEQAKIDGAATFVTRESVERVLQDAAPWFRHMSSDEFEALLAAAAEVVGRDS